MGETLSSKVFLGASVLQHVPRGALRRFAREATERSEHLSENAEPGIVVNSASALLSKREKALPDWVDLQTRFLILADVPEPALLRLPSVLGLHKPDLRLHVTRDVGAIKRLLLSQYRKEAWEGIVDAYPLSDSLVLISGDMTIREFPRARLPRVRRLSIESFENFQIDPSGSFLSWADGEILLGPSQMLQAVDPMYLADVEIRRYEMAKVSLAVLDMRVEHGLKQTEIPGLSDRHVRRLENNETRLTVDASSKLAAAFGMDIRTFLAELSRRLTRLQSSSVSTRSAESLSAFV